MNAETPILQSIHRSPATASWEPWYTEEAGAHIRAIGITSNNEGYSIVTYAGGWGFDGYTISAKADGGLTSNLGPSRIETGRDYSGLMRLSVDEERREPEGLVEAIVTASNPAKIENLLLPGDEGFGLFEDLHRKVVGLKTVIADAVDLIHPGIKPETLVYQYKGDQSASYDHEKQVASVAGSAFIDLNDSKSRVRVELDATQDYPFEVPAACPTYKKSENTVYRSGTAVVESRGEEELRALDLFTLTAFSVVQSLVEKLYK